MDHRGLWSESSKKRKKWQRCGSKTAVCVLAAAVFSGTVPFLNETVGWENMEKQVWAASLEDEGNPDSRKVPAVKNYKELYELIKEYENTGNGVPGYAYSNIGEEVVQEESFEMYQKAETLDSSGASETESGNTADFSHTNIQEETVEEADIAKTDGTYLYVMDGKGTIRIVRAEDLSIMSEIRTESDSLNDPLEMYVEGDTLQLVQNGEIYMTYEDSIALPSSDTENRVRSYYSVPEEITVVTTYDISDRSDPKKTGVYQQDGCYLSSRRTGGILYLFTSFCPTAGPDAEAREYYVPKAGGEYLSCEDIYLPAKNEEAYYNGERYLVAASVEDGTANRAKDCIAVVNGGETFYVSGKNVYAASSDWGSEKSRTDMVRFGYSAGVFTPGCTGRISGTINNSFSMNEYQDTLRVAATTESWSLGTGDMEISRFTRANSLYVLDMDLQIIGKIENLAEGEEIKSARFMGETGYFVTYRNTDPLFSVDLSDPENPKIKGELKITGFSEYLHFYGDNKLLGIGWETDPDTGAAEGLKCSMFDIRDPENVKEVDRLVLKDVIVCDALSNYKTILADPDKNVFGFAYGVNTGESYLNYRLQDHFYYGVFSYTEEKGFVPRKYLHVSEGRLYDGEMTYEDYGSLRGLYIGNVFYLVSGSGIESYDMVNDFEPLDLVCWQTE